MYWFPTDIYSIPPNYWVGRTTALSVRQRCISWSLDVVVSCGLINLVFQTFFFLKLNIKFLEFEFFFQNLTIQLDDEKNRRFSVSRAFWKAASPEPSFMLPRASLYSIGYTKSKCSECLDECECTECKK